MTTKTLVEIVGSIVNELTPLGSEERRRAVLAAMTLLGEEAISSSHLDVGRTDDEALERIHVRARSWMRQNGISVDQLAEAFLIGDENVEIIGAIPGPNNKEKVRNTYVLTGVSLFLLTGEQRFDDAAARSLCERFAFYDPTNHSKYMKDQKEFTGSRERGWILTMPGLKTAARLIKEMSSGG